jgi:hypothetical protein
MLMKACTGRWEMGAYGRVKHPATDLTGKIIGAAVNELCGSTEEDIKIIEKKRDLV